MSCVDIEGLLAERGIVVSRETIRLWVNRFRSHFADCIRKDRPEPNDKWHLDEVMITTTGRDTGSGAQLTLMAAFLTFPSISTGMPKWPDVFSIDLSSNSANQGLS